MTSNPSPYESDPEIQTAVTTGVVAEERVESGVERVHGTLVILSGRQSGTIHLLDDVNTSIGRGRGSRIWIADEGMSRNHCTILRRDDGYYIRDDNSRNGTVVNGDRVDAERRLCSGDRITVGRGVALKFTLEDPLEREASRQTLELSVSDPLTGLRNRRYLQSGLEQEFAYARRHTTSLHVLMIDIDHFKAVNDSHGHQAGDKVLRMVAEAMQRLLRVEDVIGRYGGEEFMVITRGIDDAGARVLAERVRSSVETLRTAWKGEQIGVTVSLGVAALGQHHDRPEAMISTADAALYAAKQDGRNRSVMID